MKTSIRDLFLYEATENYFFRETGYFGEDRAHATICIRCWLSKVRGRNKHGTEKPTTLAWRAEMYKFFKQRRIRCPFTRRVIIPWGRNRKHPPDGCVRLLEHAVARGRL